MKLSLNLNFSGRILCLILISLLSPALIYGAEKAKEKERALPEVVVESERLVEEQGKITIKSEGLPAEVNIITKEDLEQTPYTGDYLDMLRNVPGVNIARYTGGNFGSGISMRGFAAGAHGANTAFFVDGMPMNVMDYLHGMEDIAWLVPEMIERLEVIKGPFSPLYGDFALGGVINIITKKADSGPSVGLYGGTYGTAQGVGVLSDPSYKVTPFLVWEGYTRGGYRDNNDYQRGQFFNKFTTSLGEGHLSLRAHYVARAWGDPGYISINKIKAGLYSRTRAVSQYDRGDSEMADVVLNYSPKGGEQGFYGTLYYAYHGIDTGRTWEGWTQGRKDSFSNIWGWKLLYNYQPFDNLSVIVGDDLRFDQVNAKEWNTIQYYNYLNTTRNQEYHYFSTGVFGQVQYKPFSFLKLIGGLRFDQFQIEVNNKLYPQNSGNCSPSLWSPKFGIVITPYKDINIFANKGRGFRSPSEDELSPSSATQKANYTMGLAKLDTWDVGFNALLLKRLYIAFDYYNTLYQGEPWLDPTTLTYYNLGTSKRTGLEVEAKVFLTKELTIYGSYSHVRARLKNPPTPDACYIPYLPADMAIVGFQFRKPWDQGNQQFSLDFYYRLLGRNPANSTATLIGSKFEQYASKVAYRYKNWTASVDVTFTPRRYSAEIYADVGSLYYAPLPFLEVLGGLKYRFK
ncbi:MAG: TonB-dependent receptor [Thermodesulfobacteriota bacterium]